MRTLAIVWLTLAGLSCSGSYGTAPDPSGPTPPRDEAIPAGVTLTNPTDQTLYYAAFERKWSEEGLFIWAQCTDKPRCPAIPPHASVRVPDSDINGFFPGAREARVYFWELVPVSKGGYEVRGLRSTVVPID